MERLTYIENEKAKVVVTGNERPIDKFEKLIDKLCAYEDTGITPEKVMELKRRDDILLVYKNKDSKRDAVNDALVFMLDAMKEKK